MEKKVGKIVVERETFEMNEKSYFTYFIKGKIRGKDVKVAVIPPDKGGSEMKADLVVNPYEIKDDATGNVVKGNTFAVRTQDENGEVYECNIKPYRNSDKMLLNMLIK